MIDTTTESLVSFAAAARALPHTPHVSTLHRWRLKGVRGVKLETCLIGGRRYTSLEALVRFCDATTAAASGEPCPVRTPAMRRRSIEQAEQELAATE